MKTSTNLSKKDAIAWLSDFLKEVGEQSNRSTARQILFQIRDKKRIWGRDEDDGEETVLMQQDGEHWISINQEEMLKELKESKCLEEDEESEYDDMSESELEDVLTKDRWFYRASYVDEWVYPDGQVYFTEKAARVHIKANHYHYSSEVHDYVTHAWRNPEMEKLFDCLYVIAEMEDERPR